MSPGPEAQFRDPCRTEEYPSFPFTQFQDLGGEQAATSDNQTRKGDELFLQKLHIDFRCLIRVLPGVIPELFHALVGLPVLFFEDADRDVLIALSNRHELIYLILLSCSELH